MTNKPKAGDKITIYVKENPMRRTKALVTYVSSSGVVYFRPLKTMHFKLYPDTTLGTEAHLWAGNIYSTSDIENLVFTGSFKDLLGIALQESEEEATFEASPTLKSEEPLKLRKVNVSLDAPTMKLEDLPKHDNTYTPKLDENGHTSSVVDGTNEFFKAFASGTHHCIPPHIKINSLLTGFCEDAKKKAEEFKEAVFITDRVVSHGDIEYTVRMMLKAGLSPHQIAKEIQRQFYNAMVEE